MKKPVYAHKCLLCKAKPFKTIAAAVKHVQGKHAGTGNRVTFTKVMVQEGDEEWKQSQFKLALKNHRSGYLKVWALEHKDCNIDEILAAFSCDDPASSSTAPLRAMELLRKFPNANKDIVKDLVCASANINILGQFMLEYPGMIADDDLMRFVHILQEKYRLTDGFSIKYIISEIDNKWKSLKTTCLYDTLVAQSLVGE